jgi:FAD/FMN-containing dehydrogenase
MNKDTALDHLTRDLSHLEIITDPAQVAKLSLDYYHFSPILEKQLKDKRGDLVIRPKSTAEILEIARTCAKYRVPITVRGAGTGNYGQCIPLAGGVILDMTALHRIHWIQPGGARVDAGVKMAAFDKQAREIGWELRMAPSTYRTATIGGFIGGGSVGMGSVNYGQLRDRGNVRAIQVITLEDEPRILELRGDEVQKVNHAYGTNGIITELEIPLAPAYPWGEMIVIFEDFLTAARFGQELSDSPGIVTKMVSVHDWPIPSYFTPLQDYLPKGKAAVLLLVSAFDRQAIEDLVRSFPGEISYYKSASEAGKGTSLLEFTWNHTTLHARSVNPRITYLQAFYFTLDRLEHLYHHFRGEIWIHLEFLRFGGKVIPGGIPLFEFTTEERLQEMIHYHEEQGAGIANPHTYILEDGGMKILDPVQFAFKKEVDPYGLMNPGKTRAWWELA